MFHGRFHNSASQQEINENTNFKEHGMGYFNRHYKRNIIRTRSGDPELLPQSSVLLLIDPLAEPIPLLRAI